MIGVIFTLVLLLIITIEVGIVVLTYWIAVKNRLVRLENLIETIYSNVGNKLRKRQDVITNLLGSTKGASKHEKEIWLKFAEARSAVSKGVPINNMGKNLGSLSTQLGEAISGMRLIHEKYPDNTTKALEHFTRLDKAVAALEEELNEAREEYNEFVMMYNNTITLFPSEIIAKRLGKTKKLTMWETSGQETLNSGYGNSPTKVEFD